MNECYDGNGQRRLPGGSDLKDEGLTVRRRGKRFWQRKEHVQRSCGGRKLGK